MITTINAFRKLNENLYPEGDFIKYNYNDTPDVEEYMNQAAQAMGEMTDSLYWFETQELEEIPGIIKDITGDESYDFDKVVSYSTQQGTVKLYISSGDTGSYFIICNMNMNGKKIVDDQIVDIYKNDYSEVTPDDSNDFKGYGKGEHEDDVDPAGGTGLHSHESRKVNENFNKETDPLCIAFKANNIDFSVSPQGEIITSVEFPLGETDYWFESVDTTMTPKSKGIYTATQVSHCAIGEGGDCDVDKNIFTGTVEQAVQLIQHNLGIAKQEYDKIPKTEMTPAQPETTGPKIVGKIDLKDDGKQRFKKKSESLITSFEKFKILENIEDKKIQKIKNAIKNKTALKFKCGPANEVGIPTHITDDGLVTFQLKGDKHPTKVKTKMVESYNLIIEGAVKRHWEEIMSAIEAGTELEYKSGENFGKAIPVKYENNVVSFNNGIHVIDMYVKTAVNNINESKYNKILFWQESSDGNGDLIADGVDNKDGFKNRYVIYRHGQNFILQVNGKNKSRGPLKLVKAAAQDIEKQVIKNNPEIYEAYDFSQIPEGCEILTSERFDELFEFFEFYDLEEAVDIKNRLANGEQMFLVETYTDEEYEGFDGTDDYFDSEGHSWEAIEAIQKSNHQLQIESEANNNEGTYYTILSQRTDFTPRR